MDFLDRLRVLMENNSENNSTLAKRSGIPYTTIDGLFKRGWEKAQISTIQKICDCYNVSLDFMIYGADKLSEEGQVVAAKFDSLDDAGKELINVVIDMQIKRIKDFEAAPKPRRVPIIGTAWQDGRVETKLAAAQELKEMQNEEMLVPEDSICNS